jgi:hypothetical protein
MIDDLPVVHRMSGKLRNLRVETFSAGAKAGRTTFRAYRFELDGRALVFHAGENFADIKPFLAEGDQVELAVQRFEDEPEPREPLVYALRNVEDDCAYVSQMQFRGGYGFGHGARYSLPGISRRQRTRSLWFLAAASLPAASLAGVSWAQGSHAEAGVILGVILLMLLAVGLALVMWPWWSLRLGRPSRRERLLARVYATLSLGTPDRPAPGVYSV